MERHSPCSQRLWILEYAWAHDMVDVYQAVEASCWPEVDLESFSLDEPWRVRVVSAQIFSIVRNRRTSLYERVLAFLERTHTLLPTLVPVIKHMKIMFGLKTMVIMWMLKEGIGPVDVVYKILQFFPSKLPQYQEHCRNCEMFLMRKNQQDFKLFAHSLATDKQKLQDYTQNHMEEQYGEHYAQKTEDRLLHYLRELEKTLPKDTYIDKILKRNTPVNEEEKLLLEIVSEDSIPIATTLKMLLHCDSAFCKSERRARTGLQRSPVYAGSSNDHIKSAVSETSEKLKTVEEGHSPDVAEDSHTMTDDGDGPTKEQGLHAEGGIEGRNEVTNTSEKEADDMDLEKVSLRSGAHEGKLSPHFCSKHQRWVRNILRECPESTEEQQAQASENSPSLFPSTSSSEDLTPSGLAPPSDQHQSSHNSSEPQAVPEDAKIEDKPSSELVDRGPLTYPTPSLGGAVLKVALVRLKDLASITLRSSKPSSTSQTDTTGSIQDSARTSSQSNISENSSMDQILFVGTTSSKQTFSKLSRKYRVPQKYSQPHEKGNQSHHAERPERVRVSPHTSSVLLENAASSSTHITSSCSTPSLPEKVCSNNTTSFANIPLQTSSLHSKAPSDSTGTRSSLDHLEGCEGSRELRGSSEPCLSLHSQAFLPQSTLLQPCVVVKRISMEECLLMTDGRSKPRRCDDEEDSDSANSSFNVNSLYSSHSSESDGDESDDSDPDFRPSKKQLFRWALACDN